MSAIDERSGTMDADGATLLEQLEARANQAGLSLGPLSPGAMGLSLAAFLEGPFAGLKAIPGGRLEPLALAIQARLSSGVSYASHPSPRSAAGPDLDALFLGGEGRLGAITSATLRLVPKATVVRDATYAFNRVEDWVAALRAAIALGCGLSNARVERKGESLVLGVRAAGNTESVERDLASLSRCARIGRPCPAPGFSELPDEERELGWAELPRDGRPLSLYRLSLESLVVRGAAGIGLPMRGPSSWASGILEELRP